jgi:hypothetical protein
VILIGNSLKKKKEEARSQKSEARMGIFWLLASLASGFYTAKYASNSSDP